MDTEAGRQAWSATPHLAERLGLAVYDAAYPEIASHRKIALPTLDQQLRVAGDEKVELLGLWR